MPSFTTTEYLKSIGATDDDIKLFKPEFLTALDNQFKAKDDEITRRDEWESTAYTEYQSTARALADSSAEVARLKSLQERGLSLIANQDDATPTPAPSNRNADGTFRPEPAVSNIDTSKFVTKEEYLAASGQFGSAIAQAATILKLHAQYGLDPEALDVEALRNKAMKEGKSIREVYERDFNIGAKQAERTAKAAADREAEIRADERMKVKSEILNPHTGQPVASEFPIFSKPREAVAPGGGAVSRQPWSNRNEREGARLQKGLAAISKIS